MSSHSFDYLQFCFSILLASTALSKGLVVQLFAEESISEFRSIDDVNSCRIDAKDFCVPIGGTSEVYWKRVVEIARRRCRKGNLEMDQPQYIEVDRDDEEDEKFKDNYSKGLDAVKEGQCKYFMAASSTLTAAAENEHCNVLSVVGKPFGGSFSVGFVLPKNSSITEPISIATLKLHQKEGFPTLVEYGTPEKCKISSSANRLDWSKMNIVFYVTWTLHGLMLVYMFTDRRQRTGE